MPRHILYGIGRCPQQRLTQVKMSVVMRLRNPRSEDPVTYGDGVNWLEDEAVRGETSGCRHQREGEGVGQERRKEDWGEREGRW